MILTCGICGHRGEDGTTYNHDCYWVFRERSISNKDLPTVQRCALRTGHEGPHMWIHTRRLGQFGECRTLAPAENVADVTGFNPIAKQLARAFAQDACSTFTPSQHANAHKRTSGANIHCVKCHKPQYQHWLRQALENGNAELHSPEHRP